MTIDEAIKLYKKHSECIQQTLITKEEAVNVYEWLKELKKDREILNGLSTYFQSLIAEAVINQRPCMFDMRDATEAERKSVMRYIANAVFTTGVDFWSIIGEVNVDADCD